MGALDLTGCDCNCEGQESRCGGSLPDSPHCALNYHFGMLLGVDDFRVEQGFHIGRLRRHQRALHGYGVVFGYAVEFDAEHAEIRVEPGYAVDRRGRDLELDKAQCLSLPAWWEKHRDDDDFADHPNPDDVTFDADIVLCYGTCLSRPVPAIADPCAGNSADIAYSRICETITLNLVHRRADEEIPPQDPPGYHLLRLLLGLESVETGEDGNPLPDDQWLLDQQATVEALPEAERPAALAELWQAVIARAAANTSDPLAAIDREAENCLILARLSDVHVFKGPDGWQADVGGIDIDERATLLPTQLLQDGFLRPPPPKLPPDPPPPAAPAGPVLAADGVRIVGDILTLTFDRPLAEASVGIHAFGVSEFTAEAGWNIFMLDVPEYDPVADPLTVSIQLDRAPIGERIRVLVRGTGLTPLLGVDLTPAGAVSSSSDGVDLYFTLSGE